MKIVVRPPVPEEIEDLQRVFNHASIIAELGGFTMLDVMKDRIKKGALGIWGALLPVDAPLAGWIGATMIAGRPQSHLLKYGSVGVLEQFRRRRVGTALYVAMTAQGLLEGRRLYEDSIVGDNAVQFEALPKMGILPAGELRHRTGSAKSLWLFQKSLLDPGAWAELLLRLPPSVEIHLWENYYTRDLWEKNMAIYDRYPPSKGLPQQMAAWADEVRHDPRFVVHESLERPARARG